jgi:hypothetical protein
MKTDELREKYLEFFQSKGHRFGSRAMKCWADWTDLADPSVLFTRRLYRFWQGRYDTHFPNPTVPTRIL